MKTRRWGGANKNERMRSGGWKREDEGNEKNKNMADVHDIQSWLNGDKLRSQKIREQYPLIGLIVGLVFLYILTGYQSAKQQHRLTDTKKEMLDAKFRYMTISAQLTNSTRQSQVIEVLKVNGSELQENRIPPVKIK